MPTLLAAWRAACTRAARRRGPGPRPRAAPAGVAPRRARPTGSSSSATTTSRSTAGGSPTFAASWASPTRCPACVGVDLVVNYRCPATGRRARRPADRAQRGAVRQDDPCARPDAAGPIVLAADARRRARPDRPACSRRCRTTAARRAILARTNRELAAGRRGRARAPASRSGRRRSSCSSRRRSSTPPAERILADLAELAPGSRPPCGSPRCAPDRRRDADRVGGAGRPGRWPPRLARRRRCGAVLALGRAVLDRSPTSRRRVASAGPPSPGSAGRRDADPRDRPRDEGPRVRPRRRRSALDAGRFPSARSLADAPEPAALEEERRLAYVAWTRARRSLTLVYDPATPSPFLLEAFVQEELA